MRQRLHDTLGPNDCSVWLYSCGEAFGYGSLARGDWDGFSDTDLLVVAANQAKAELAADQLAAALVGDDVLAIDLERWQAMAHSPRPTGGRSAPRRSASIRYPLEATAVLASCLRRPPPRRTFAASQLRLMAKHWGRNLTRPVPMAARW